MGNKQGGSFYQGLSVLIHRIDRIELWVVVISFLAVITINSMEIFARFLLNRSFFWVHEVTILLANIVYFLGAALVYKRRQDIQMEYFLKFFRPGTQRAWDFIIDGISIYFFLILFYHGMRLLKVQAKYFSMGLGIPNHYFSLPLVIGTLSMILIMVHQFLERYFQIERKEV